MKKPNQKGATLVEATVAVALLSSLALSVLAARGFMDRQALRAQDRAFAAGQADRMFGELRLAAAKSGVKGLEVYNDGNQYSPVLTTDRTANRPGVIAAAPTAKGSIP